MVAITSIAGYCITCIHRQTNGECRQRLNGYDCSLEQNRYIGRTCRNCHHLTENICMCRESACYMMTIGVRLQVDTHFCAHWELKVMGRTCGQCQKLDLMISIPGNTHERCYYCQAEHGYYYKTSRGDHDSGDCGDFAPLTSPIVGIVGAWREVKNDELVMRRFGKRVRSWLNRFMGMGLPKICEDCMNVEYVVCGKGEGLFLCRMDYQTLADHCILNSCRDRCSGDVPLAKGLKIWL